MTNAELIAILSQQPPHAEALSFDEALGFNMPVVAVDLELAGEHADIMVDQIVLLTRAPT